MPFIETKDHTSLYYKDWGTGKPVLFIHGWTLGADIWEYQMTYLADQGLRCIAYDQRGCGRSSQPGHGYNADTFADDLATLIEQLDLREVILAGHSMGAATTARYLSRHGAGRVAQAVLIAPTTPFLLKTADNPEGLDRRGFEETIQGLRQDRPHFLTLAAPTFFGTGTPNEPVSAEMVQWGLNLALQASPKATIDMFRALSETDFRPDMRAFTMPTLIIHGDTDVTAPIELSGRKTAQAIPGAQLKVYEGAPHGLILTDRDRLNRDLLAFIRG